jgi:hypothetical protein
MLKAIGEPYNFSECEIFPRQEKEHTFSPIEISMSVTLKKHYGVDRGICVFDENDLDEKEIVAIVYLFRDL